MSSISVESSGESRRMATITSMNHGGNTRSARQLRHWLPIVVGGLIAGGLDLICAYVSYGPGVPRVIAAGLLGRPAIHGGAGAYVLGIFLQFFIATMAAAVYYAASRKLHFLTEHFLVCGLFYGMSVFLVMTLIVVPLSALHARGPFALTGLIQGLLIHMICIGLPIAFSVRRFSS
jgi:hypothetical protein